MTTDARLAASRSSWHRLEFIDGFVDQTCSQWPAQLEARYVL